MPSGKSTSVYTSAHIRPAPLIPTLCVGVRLDMTLGGDVQAVSKQTHIAKAPSELPLTDRCHTLTDTQYLVLPLGVIASTNFSEFGA